MIFRTFFGFFMSVAVLGILLVNVYPVSEFEQVEEYPEYHSGWLQYSFTINQTLADNYNDNFNTSLEAGDSIMSFYIGTQHIIEKLNPELCNSDVYSSSEATSDEIKECLKGQMEGNFSDPILSRGEETEWEERQRKACEEDLDSLYETDSYQQASNEEKEDMEDQQIRNRDLACSVLASNEVTWYGSYAAIVFCFFSTILCLTTTFKLTGKKLCGFTLLLCGLIIMAYSGHHYYHILEISSNFEAMASNSSSMFEIDVTPGVTLFFNAGAGLSSFIMSIFVFRSPTDDDDW